MDATVDAVSETDVESDAATTEPLACNPTASAFDLVYSPPDLDKNRNPDLPDSVLGSRSVRADDASLDTVGAAIVDGELVVELNEVYPGTELEIVLASGTTPEMPLAHEMHGEFGNAPEGTSYAQYSAVIDDSGELATTTGIRVSTGGTVELTACPEQVGEAAEGNFSIVYDIMTDEPARPEGTFSVVVVESDGSIRCPAQCP